MFLGSRTEVYVEPRRRALSGGGTGDWQVVARLSAGQGRRYKRLPGTPRRHRLIPLTPWHQLHIIYRDPPRESAHDLQG